MSSFVIFALWTSWQADRHQEEARIERIAQLNELNKVQCDEIEALKTGEREEAIEDYRQLDRNAQLLGITVTDELRAVALEERNDRLARYAQARCPRTVLRP
jgi:hypothetical protein